MPPPNKRAFASRQSAAVSAVKRKRRDSTGEREVPDSGPSAGELSDSEDSDSTMDSEIDQIQVQVSDAEDDILRLEQPAKGWKEAERTLAGYSKTNAGKTPQSRWNYKDRVKKQQAENTLLKKKYGDISRFFTSESSAPTPAPAPPETDAPIAQQQLSLLRPTPETLLAQEQILSNLHPTSDDSESESPPQQQLQLNYIEYYWGALKKYTREHCQYSFAELEGTVLEAMDSVSLRTIRRFAERSKRWTMAYINGLTEEQRIYAEKVYKSHRREYRQVFV